MNRLLAVAVIGGWLAFPAGVQGAYHHGGDTDSEVVLDAYPTVEGTKLDSCALCHTGGQYEKKPGVVVELGSCQWCHYSYGYDESGIIADTLNSYGRDYATFGRNYGAFAAIALRDSDGDGFSNSEEIAALRYPGNADDDPTKAIAPFRVIARAELEELPAHRQLMLMNTHKSGDFYAEYTGVSMAELLDDSGVLAAATGLTVYAPDGWAQYHPLEPDEDPLLYHVYGVYPGSLFYYDVQADDQASDSGWCSYAAPAVEGLVHGGPIEVEDGLQMMLAYARDGQYLEAGRLTLDNKLDGEGPFRVVVPQKFPGPPDQASTAKDQNVIWPFDPSADHNAGYSSRAATVIRVEPLPVGTTDVDILEAGWNYVEEGKVLIYGAIDPQETILLRLDELALVLRTMDGGIFQPRSAKRTMLQRLALAKHHLVRGQERPALAQLKGMKRKVDGCVVSGVAERNDWIGDCASQRPLYWAFNELEVLLAIEE